MRLIALTGKAGCGKDTVGEILCGLSDDFERIAFADPMKEMLEPLLQLLGEGPWPWEHRALKEKPIASIGVSPRRLAQTLGTEWGRGLVHPYLWVKCAGFAAAAIEREGAQGLVITDCRFENEAAWVRGRGGEVWHILRPQASAVAAHVSEAGVAVAPGDSIIDNSGTLDELHDQVRRALAGELKVEGK